MELVDGMAELETIIYKVLNIEAYNIDMMKLEHLKTAFYKEEPRPYDFHNLNKVSGLKIKSDFSRDDIYADSI